VVDEVDLDSRIRAALAASRELGADYDSAMADSIRRIVAEHTASSPIVASVGRPLTQAQVVSARPRRFGGHGFAGFSLIAAVPLSGIAGGIGHLPGLAICWSGIVLVNAVERLAQRREERSTR
jgi:hypothetical protein